MASKSWIRRLEEELHQLLLSTDLPERMADILQRYPHTGSVKERAWEMVSTDAVEYLACEAQRIVHWRESSEYPRVEERMNWKADEAIPEEAIKKFKEEYPRGFE